MGQYEHCGLFVVVLSVGGVFEDGCCGDGGYNGVGGGCCVCGVGNFGGIVHGSLVMNVVVAVTVILVGIVEVKV